MGDVGPRPSEAASDDYRRSRRSLSFASRATADRRWAESRGGGGMIAGDTDRVAGRAIKGPQGVAFHN